MLSNATYTKSNPYHYNHPPLSSSYVDNENSSFGFLSRIAREEQEQDNNNDDNNNKAREAENACRASRVDHRHNDKLVLYHHQDDDETEEDSDATLHVNNTRRQHDHDDLYYRYHQELVILPNNNNSHCEASFLPSSSCSCIYCKYRSKHAHCINCTCAKCSSSGITNDDDDDVSSVSFSPPELNHYFSSQDGNCCLIFGSPDDDAIVSLPALPRSINESNSTICYSGGEDGAIPSIHCNTNDQSSKGSATSSNKNWDPSSYEIERPGHPPPNYSPSPSNDCHSDSSYSSYSSSSSSSSSSSLPLLHSSSPSKSRIQSRQQIMSMGHHNTPPNKIYLPIRSINPANVETTNEGGCYYNEYNHNATTYNGGGTTTTDELPSTTTTRTTTATVATMQATSSMSATTTPPPLLTTTPLPNYTPREQVKGSATNSQLTATATPFPKKEMMLNPTMLNNNNPINISLLDYELHQLLQTEITSLQTQRQSLHDIISNLQNATISHRSELLRALAISGGDAKDDSFVQSVHQLEHLRMETKDTHKRLEDVERMLQRRIDKMNELIVALPPPTEPNNNVANTVRAANNTSTSFPPQRVEKLEGQWFTLTKPTYQDCLGFNDDGNPLYHLGRMSFEMFMPGDLVCAIQAVFNPIMEVVGHGRSQNNHAEDKDDDRIGDESRYDAYGAISQKHVSTNNDEYCEYHEEMEGKESRECHDHFAVPKALQEEVERALRKSTDDGSEAPVLRTYQ